MTLHKTCRAFLDQWDEISHGNSDAGRAHALEGLRRVEALGNPPVLYARAQTIYGSSLRGTEPVEAVKVLSQALCIYRDKIDERLDEADALRRFGIALEGLPKPAHEQALTALNTAYKFADFLGEEEMTARVEIEIGRVRGGMGECVLALERFIDAVPKLSPGLYLDNTLHNIQAIMVMAKRAGQSVPRDLRRRSLEELRLVRLTPSSRERWGSMPPTRQVSYGRPKRNEADAAARWTIGLLLDADRQREAAARHLKSALKDFIALGFTVKAAALSLDLAEIYAKLGKWHAVASVARRATVFLKDSPRSAEAFVLLAQAAKGKEFDDLQAKAEACRIAIDGEALAA